MTPEIIAGIVFMSIFFAITLIGQALSGTGKDVDERLRTTTYVGIDPHKSSIQLQTARSILRGGDTDGFFLPKLGGLLTSEEEIRQSSLKIRLANAGYNGDNAIRTYLGAKFLLAVGMPAVVIGVQILLHHPLNALPLHLAVFGALGFYIPDFAVFQKIRARQEQIFCGLPDALDLMVICVEAGLGLDAALLKVSDEIHFSNRVLSEELNWTCMEMRAGRSRKDALNNLAVRTGVADVKALVAILVQAERFGTSIAQALRIHSDDMRLRRRQRAEEAAAKTAVKLVFPLVLFIFPAIFVVLAGPAAIRIGETILKH